MELVHTCTNYGYMQEHTQHMYEKGWLFANNMIMESQASGISKLRLGMLVNFPDLDQESE